MSHSLHLLVVRAKNGEEACRIAEGETLDFGNDNNWRSFVGAVSEDNEVYHDEHEEQSWMEDCESIEAINKKVTEWRGPEVYDAKEGKALLLKAAKKPNAMKSMDWYGLRKYAEFKQEGGGKTAKFDVLYESFYEYKYEEEGVTHLESLNKKDGKLWVVFMDMHS
jgi:hypothetical protein